MCVKMCCSRTVGEAIITLFADRLTCARRLGKGVAIVCNDIKGVVRRLVTYGVITRTHEHRGGGGGGTIRSCVRAAHLLVGDAPFGAVKTRRTHPGAGSVKHPQVQAVAPRRAQMTHSVDTVRSSGTNQLLAKASANFAVRGDGVITLRRGVGSVGPFGTVFVSGVPRRKAVAGDTRKGIRLLRSRRAVPPFGTQSRTTRRIETFDTAIGPTRTSLFHSFTAEVSSWTNNLTGSRELCVYVFRALIIDRIISRCRFNGHRAPQRTVYISAAAEM